MLEILLICIIICCVVVICFLKQKYKKEKKSLLNEINDIKKSKISDKDLQFLEFTVDMYIKYAEELDINSKEQHEFIVKELERIRSEYLLCIK